MPRSIDDICSIVASKTTGEEKTRLLMIAAELTEHQLVALDARYASEDDVMRALMMKGRSAHEAPPDSPRRRLAAWIREHPTPNILLQGPGPEVDCEMRRLLREMPLPPHIYKVFEHHLYTVPAEGLFVAEQPSLVSPSQTQAFERWDLVQLFKERAKSLGRLLVSTLLLYGLRRTGKTFSVPWAQVEAIRHLEGGEGSPAPRCSHVLVVACAQVDQPSLEDYPLLLAAASYLRIPIVFDEFIHKWADLPAALNGFLSSSGAHFEGVALRPLQFVLMDSMQRSVKDVTGSAGSLYRRDNIGVPCAIAVPPPSLQLLAGMLLQYHPDCYPGMLLRAVATNGRYLDRYQVRPTTELQELDLLYLRTHALLQGEHLSAVETAIQMRGHVKLLQVQDQVAQLSQLQSCELFEASPMDDSSLQLVEPQLLTIAQLAKAKARSSHEREAALAVAEGLLLEVLLRTDLTNSLLHCLRLSGKPTLWWGNVGTAELDLVLEFPDGDEPVVWISCKRQHEDQECKPFLEHINQLQGMAKVTKAQSKRRGSESKEGESVAVRLMRAMVAKGVHLVAVSGYSRTVRDAEGLLAFPGKFPATLELEFQGTKHSLPYKRSAFLLHELVEPQCAVPLNTAPRVMRRDVTAAMQQMSAESGLVS